MARFSDEQLHELIQKDFSLAQMARRLGVSKSAVSQRVKKLGVAVCKDVQMRSAPAVVDRELNCFDQLKRINAVTHQELETLRQQCADAGDGELLKDHRDLILKCVKEIRAQLSLQHEILASLHSIQMIEAFQKEVLNAIAEADPATRDKIVRTLEQRRALRSTIDLN